MDIKDLQKLVVKFRDDRNWKQFHNPKDMALSLSLEASEVLELTQWKNQEELEKFFSENKEALADELSDVLYWILLIANDYAVDLSEALKRKIIKNEAKYPVDIAKDNKSKYSEY